MLVTVKSTEFFAKNEAGGKGFSLYQLSNAGLPIPEWVVLGKRYFTEYFATNKIDDEIQKILNDYNANNITAKACEQKIQDLILAKDSTPFLLEGLSKALEILPQTMISVRSSAADEDGTSHSFAGQLSSFLYVKNRNEILKYIKLCWASGFSERGLIYRKKNNLDLSKISVSVVLQRMIDPDKSGVVFTCDPVAQKLDRYVISSVYGVGEGLVSGALASDSYWVDAQSGHILSSEIVEKSGQMKGTQEGHCEISTLDENLKNSSSLSDTEIQDLWKIGSHINQYFNRPQDIEWAIEKNKLYILQSRPVTNLSTDLIGYPNLWDNSNIIESYGGLTSPLSFSFALRNYKAVYVQFCEVLGVPTDIIKEMDSYLSYMLGSINGRVYYNLFNWYKLVGVLPGFKQNRQFMETMMGVTESLTDEIANRIKPHPSWDTLQGRFRKFISGLNFLKYHFTIQSMVNDFLKTFNKDYHHFRSLPLKRMRGDQLIRVYADVETNMLGRWKAPIINDFLCMVHFGLLRKLTLKWLSKLDSTIQNDLLSGEGGLESAEPMKALQQLAYSANQNSELKKIIVDNDASDLMEILNQSSYHEYYKKIISYIDRYGFRCMSEMKLEEVDLMSDPTYLFVCIKNYLKSNDVKDPSHTHDQEIRKSAELKVNQELSGLKKYIYFWVLKHARKAVKNRENTRFARTRIYGVARTIFQHIGEDMSQIGAINHPRDVFWLSIEEIMGVYNGTLPSYDIISFIELRKKSYGNFETEPDSRIMTRGAVYWKNSFIKEVEIPNYAGQDFDLQGLPCCPGIIEGTVKVISSPKDDLSLNGEILVADRTDPGWVPLYPSISGLLVERGSLLSHSAIVAREMGIPAIVSIPGLTKKLRTGMRVRLDGKLGTIKILQEDST